MAKITPAPLTRPIYEIAREIEADYAAKDKPVYWSALPYVNAMLLLNDFNSRYYEDDAASVLTYAVSNLSTWRGETAKRVKAEINAALADHRANRR